MQSRCGSGRGLTNSDRGPIREVILDFLHPDHRTRLERVFSCPKSIGRTYHTTIKPAPGDAHRVRLLTHAGIKQDITMPTSTTTQPVAVAFHASGDFITALDLAAAERGETRSHFARKALATLLRDAGLLAHEAPVTQHDARRKQGQRR